MTAYFKPAAVPGNFVTKLNPDITRLNKMSVVVVRRLFFLIAAVFLCVAAHGQTKSAAPKSDALTNKAVIDLHKAGLDDEIILTKIAQSKCSFDLSTDALIDLKAKGVSPGIIKAMMNKSASGTGGGSVAAAASAKESRSSGADASAPELMNHVYVFQKEGKPFLPLEKSMAGRRTRNLGFKAFVLLQVEGANSAVSLSADDIQYFVINTGGAALPEAALYTLKSAKGKREVETGSVGTFDGVKGSEKNQVAVNISKMDNGAFKIMPTKALVKGEYFFTTKPEAGASSMEVYTFGIK